MIQKQIIVIDKVEDDEYDGKAFKKVTDKAGDVFNVKVGRGGKLKEKWHLLQEGKAIKPTYDTYQGKPFISDIELVEDAFLQKATAKLQTGREQSIETQVAIKEVGEDWRTRKRKDGDALVIAREQWLMTHLRAEEENDKTKEKDTKTGDKETVWTVKDYVDALRNQDYKSWWKDWAVQNKVDNKPTLEKTLETMNIEQLYELKGRLK